MGDDDFYNGIFGSLDFLNPVVPVIGPTREWYECVGCGTDLRSGHHKENCTLSSSEKTSEVERVSYIVKTFFKAKGLTILKGNTK